MRTRSVLTLIVGLVVVAAAAVFGLLHAYDRAHTLRPQTAVIETDESVVGTSFSGSISKVSVKPGDKVTSGQELFRLQSPTLQQARETSRFNDAGVGYRMVGDDVLVFEATANGVVGEMPYGVGSFVPANTEITSIAIGDSLRVRASLVMDTEQFGRMAPGAVMRLTLPSGEKVDTQVYEVAFEEGETAPIAVVRARGGELTSAGNFFNGSPVAAEPERRGDDGLGAWTAAKIGEFFSPRGY
ncbi:MAG: hypothetical protein Q4P07_06460 [Ornithinimicrobium sp.]|uniref:hypothetical protein n=1 Tax=Ornithinimicrobium sp. TaxID=1977084 RepID=UPI0026DF392B|nr:hypothetical protein [Ornithinimicrobium sp.]MDO5739775.1 hypothetical protein [Ornithinimicrobium sp.]